MNKIIALTLAVSALALTGCRTTEQEVARTSSRSVRFHAVGADTRTAFAAPEEGVYRTLWTENDEAVLLSLNYGRAQESAVTVAADGVTASFEAAFDAASGAPYTFYAVSPASAARAISPSRKAWSVYVAADQTPLQASVDEAAQLLVAKSAASSVLPEDVDLHFSHLTAYGRVTLRNLELGEAAVSKVELTFGTPVVGEWYWGEDGSLTANGASHTITLNTSAVEDLWFACAPVDVSGTTLKLNVYTDQGVLGKEITFPEGRKFSSGKVARFSVDMDGVTLQEAGDVFVRVDSVQDLQAGDQILIVNAGGQYALAGQANGSTPYRLRAAVTIVDGVISDPGRATVLTLGAGNRAGTWSFSTGSGYLASRASGNALTEVSSVNANASWTVSISGGTTTVTASSGSSTLLKHNNAATAGRFSCYKSTSQGVENVVLYRKGTGSAGFADGDPLAEESTYGSYVSGAKRLYVKGSDQISRTYGANGQVTFSLLNASTREELVISGYDSSLRKGQKTKVGLFYKKGRQTVKEASYELTVVREDGPKVWLGNGSGEGFIIKK